MSSPPVIDHTAQGRARSIPELAYAVGLTPCPECKSRLRPRVAFSTTGNVTTVRVDCGVCGTRRDEKFTTDGDPTGGAHARLQLGMENPSEIITPKQFADDIDRLVPLVGDPTKLSGAAHLASSKAAWAAVTPAYELEKFGEHAIVLPTTWKQQGTKRETIAKRRDELIKLAEQHLAERDARMQHGLAAAKAEATPVSKYPPSVAFRLGVEAGSLAGIDDSLALFQRLARETEPKLAHAVSFGLKAASIRRSQQADHASLGLAAAEGSGVGTSPFPTSAAGWAGWRDAMHAAGKARVNKLGQQALEVATAAFDLERARQLLQRIAYLRASAPDHAVLTTEAQRTRKAGELARTQLFDALEPFRVFSGLDDAREELNSWAEREAYDAASARTTLEDLAMDYRVKQDQQLRGLFAKIADNLPL